MKLEYCIAKGIGGNIKLSSLDPKTGEVMDLNLVVWNRNTTSICIIDTQSGGFVINIFSAVHEGKQPKKLDLIIW